MPLTLTSTKLNSAILGSQRHLRDIHCPRTVQILLCRSVTQTDCGKVQTLWGEAATEVVAVKAKALWSMNLSALPDLCCCNVIKPCNKTPKAVGATHRIPGNDRQSYAECGTSKLREYMTTNIYQTICLPSLQEQQNHTTTLGPVSPLHLPTLYHKLPLVTLLSWSSGAERVH